MATSTSASASRSSPRVDYAQRLRKVTEYIHDHLDDDLDLNRLADVACMSAFHWHRVYHAMHGETVAATVRRLRMHRAAGFIAHTGMTMGEVARKSGYDSVQSFTRVFKSLYGMPPARFRAQGHHAVFEAAVRDTPGPGGAEGFPVEIREMPAMPAIAVAHRGPYMEIGRAFELLYGRLAAEGRLVFPFRSIGVYLDDPDATDPRGLRSWACVALSRAGEDAQFTIRGGPYAVLRYRGPYATMRGAYRWLYGDWLVRSGREAADAPVIEEYLNDPRTTAPADLLTDIALPLRE